MSDVLFVLDASMALSWCFEDEASKVSLETLNSLVSGMAAVPGLWLLEVANVLLVAERRGRIAVDEVFETVELLSSLPIVVEETKNISFIWDLVKLGRKVSLTSYDASYLYLAQKLGLPLATLDKRLIETAEDLGVPIYNPLQKV